jgi:hypothetical protein
VVGASPTFLAKLDQILLLAARYRLPTMFPAVPAVRAGGLLSYVHSAPSMRPRSSAAPAGTYVSDVRSTRSIWPSIMATTFRPS